VAVGEQRFQDRGAIGGPAVARPRVCELAVALTQVPAQICSSAQTLVRAEHGDLLDLVLPHVRDPEIPGRRIEADPPRVAHAAGPHQGIGVAAGTVGAVGIGVVRRREVASGSLE